MEIQFSRTLWYVLIVGEAYDDLYEPTRFGSCGGGVNSGSGGGVIFINATGVMQINGEVKADGLAASDR